MNKKQLLKGIYSDGMVTLTDNICKCLKNKNTSC
jgi:hypothetical protein